MQGSAEEKASLTEVWAHAVLGVNKHVVRYYSAWAEHNHMIIQNEFCNGGSLHDQVKEVQPLSCTRNQIYLRPLTDICACCYRRRNDFRLQNDFLYVDVNFSPQKQPMWA